MKNSILASMFDLRARVYGAVADAKELRERIAAVEADFRPANRSEVAANVVLALRHLEDAEDRLTRALTEHA